MRCIPPLTKILYLIQLQSHYTPALALTDSQGRISGNVNTSKNPLQQSHSPEGIKHYQKGRVGGRKGWGVRDWVWEGQMIVSKQTAENKD